jgi:hypothetical protein
LGIGAGYQVQRQIPSSTGEGQMAGSPTGRPDVITLAEPEGETNLHCFVIMPFREHVPEYRPGFFNEVLRSLIAPAGKKAGFIVSTANLEGSDVIQSTIVNRVQLKVGLSFRAFLDNI